ncbi:MAG TPA: VWA domain-containing protein [Verrucomicrobiae bacterium]
MPPPQSLQGYSGGGAQGGGRGPSQTRGGRGPETDEFHASRRPEFTGAPRVDGSFEPRNTGSYSHLVESSFHSARNQPLSTFSIDVDTASYANVRRFLNEGRMPPRDAVRIEELVNYFSYDYPQPRGDDPFSANIEVAGCPWNPEHRLVRIGLHGREIARDKRPPSNFVFLIDVSGSMSPQERLPLLKQALRQLVKKMNAEDRVAIVVYASEAGLKLESTSCEKKEKILRAIDELGAGGSTNGGDGIRQAYRVAEQNFIREGVNRVLLCTDGDFNVGTTDQNELIRLIQREAKSGVFLTTLGVGTDNYKDALMQNLADKGNGNYHYLDSLEEAQKVLIDQMNGTLVTIAKDVKIQVEFNPAQVGAYRLIGYEKRLLRKEDFNNDAKDAGEIGAGHTVTALYEIVPPGRPISGAVDDLKYQQPMEEKPERYVTTGSRELLTLKLRYKQPDGERSRLLEFAVTDTGKSFRGASRDFRFAASVASFGMLLRDSEFKGDASYRDVLNWAESAKGDDAEGYRSEFINLVRKARSLDRSN